MTNKRFTINYRENTRLYEVKDNLHIFNCGGFAIEYNAKKCCEELNNLHEENERLKAQLYFDEEEGICNICKHHYLVKDDETEFGYYNSRCKKGHYECARISLKHCKDFGEVEK